MINLQKIKVSKMINLHNKKVNKIKSVNKIENANKVKSVNKVNKIKRQLRN